MAEEGTVTEPPRKTRKSALEGVIRTSAKERGVDDRLRISNVTCSLRRALSKENHNHEQLTDKEKVRLHFFHKEADRAGVMRRIVGFVGNFIILDMLEQNVTNFPEINKTFYDQVWSACDFVFGSSRASKTNPYIEYTRKFIGDDDHHPLKLASLRTLLECKEKKPPIAMEQRQGVCRDMAISASQHLENLPIRAKASLNYEIRVLAEKEGMTDKKLVKELSTQAQASLNEFPQPKPFTFEGFQDNHQIIQLVREYQSHLPCEHPSKFIKQKPKSDTEPKRKPPKPPSAMKLAAEKVPHLLFPFMKFVANRIEALYDKDTHDEDEVEEFDDDDSADSILEEETSKITSALVPRRKPKRFGPLPRWKLQPCFVEYTFSNLRGKRKHDELDNPNCVPENLWGDLFHLDFIYQMRHRGTNNWHVMGFRTNGVTLIVRLSTARGDHPSVPNMEELVESGYQLKKPDQPLHVSAIDIDGKGAFKCDANRKDVSVVSQIASPHVKIIAVDPGEKKPVAVCEMDLNTTDVTSTGLSLSPGCHKYWDISKSEYSKDSGRDEVIEREKHRRDTNRAYGAAIDAFSDTRYRTCQLSKFNEYIRVVGQTFETMAKELISLERKKMRHARFRKTRSALDKIANRLLGTDHGTNQRLKAFPNEHKIRIVFYGAGSWNSRGAPRKATIKRIASKGVCLVTDEYKTSKTCPCCGHESIEDIDDAPRVRRCKNARDGKCSMSEMDRDQIGALNIALCGHWCLKHNNEWPEHLKRPEKK